MLKSMTVLPRTLIAIFLLIGILISTFIGISFTADSYAYYEIGKFIATLPQFFEQLNMPNSIFPPMFGLEFYYFSKLPSYLQSFAYVLFQNGLLIVNCVFIFYILKDYFTKTYAILGMVIFYLLPFNLIYTTEIFSEILASFFVSLSLFLAFKFFKKRKLLYICSSFFVSCLAFLTKFGLAPILFIIFIILVREFVVAFCKNRRKFNWLKSQVFNVFICLAGAISIFFWIYLHFLEYRQIVISSVSGRHIYNHIVAGAKLLPKSDSDIYRLFLKAVPSKDLIFKPFWQNQDYLQNSFGDSEQKDIYKNLQVDNLYFRFAKAAALNNIFEYLISIFSTTYKNFVTVPFHDPKMANPNIAYSYCRIDWTDAYCRPPDDSFDLVKNSWQRFIDINVSLYPWIGNVGIFLLVVGLCDSMKRQNSFIKTLVIIFLAEVFFQGAMEWTESRYLIAMYLPYAVLMVFGLRRVYYFFIKS